MFEEILDGKFFCDGNCVHLMKIPDVGLRICSCKYYTGNEEG